MKINIAFLGHHNNAGIGGGDRKFEIYFKNLSELYFEKYFIYVTKHEGDLHDTGTGDKVVLVEEQIEDFLATHGIVYVYFAGAKIQKSLHERLVENYIGLVNVNFTPCYDPSGKHINLIISQTDYRKLVRMHGPLVNAYVVYNPIDVDNWIMLSKQVIGSHRSFFKDKKYIIGRIARAEPSKRHFLIIATLALLQAKKNYSYGFIFAGMPYLYRKVLQLLLDKEMYASILFLPELKKLEDIADFYKSIDLFWQTSWIGESFGNVIAEAFCFQVPVITDFKAFYRNKKVIPEIYDAQIELVDHERNGGYTRYPSTVIDFFKSHTKTDLQVLGNNGYEKSVHMYDVKDTTVTLAKILYEIGKERGIYQRDEIFEQAKQNPTPQEVGQFKDVYIEKIALCQQTNTLPRSYYYVYMLLNNVRRGVEYGYLFIRKLAKTYFKKNIEL